jgi:3-hydroxyisobutyrate dehydrogenase-like beta-hydroxyacid dehydrogenase
MLTEHAIDEKHSLVTWLVVSYGRNMIAFLGLGRMGAPMARRLVDTGNDVVVWNRTAPRTAGFRAAPTAADAVRDSDVVITMLSDPAAVTAVTEQIGSVLAPGTVLIEMSSIGPAAVQDLRKRLPDSVELVDAPVLGSVDVAATGELTILAGGDVGRVEPVLAALGTIVRCGELGAGARRKVLAISAVVGGVALIAELLELARALDVPDAREVLAAGPLGALIPRAFSESADFPIRLAAKDLGLALDAADLSMISAARATLLAAADQEADLSHAVR